MLKKFLAIILVLAIALCFTACGEKNNIPEYETQEFGISGFWAPYEISEESFQMYKDAGFNTLAMINHSLGNTSEEQFYLGSERTMKALEICKKVGLKAIINYNDWKAEQVEGAGYNSDTPFSKYDLYGEYKDIISGVHICDEPKADSHIALYSDKTLVDDFKKVYPNADYIVNLIPIHGATYWGYDSFQDMLDVYGESFMSQFENPYISIDIYPFHTQVSDVDLYLATNHEMIAEKAKEYGAEKTFILQASTGNEFEEDLSEGDMRWQVYVALAFGADNLQYYCYSVPKGSSDRNYNYCILNNDNTPSKLYNYVQEINNEIQSFASAFLAYDWDEAIGIVGAEETTFRLSSQSYDENFDYKEFKDVTHYVSAAASHDLLISQFTSDTYGEAYMLVNYADRSDTNTVTATFKDCDAVAIYGGDDYSGTPKIVELDAEGKFTLELAYGEGVFVTPIA